MTLKKRFIGCNTMVVYLTLSVGLGVYNKHLLNKHHFPMFLLAVMCLYIFNPHH